MTDDRFLICLPYILKEEGGNDDDPHDPGGRTSRGIIQREYDVWRRQNGQPTRDVWQAGDDEVAAIYRTQYWLPLCPTMPAGVDLELFDMNVNNGPHEAAILLQRAVGVTADGHIGIVTMGAVNAKNPLIVIAAISNARTAFYQSLRTFRYFGKGWLGRVQRIEKVAQAMVGAP